MSISKMALWPVLAACISFMLIGCSEDLVAPRGPSETMKANGTLNIVFNTFGPDADYNGVVFEIKSYPSGSVTAHRVHEPGLYAFALNAGRYEVTIKDVMWNGDLQTAAVQRVHVLSGQPAETRFELNWIPIFTQFDAYAVELVDQGLIQPYLCSELHGMCITGQQSRDRNLDWVAAALLTQQIQHVANLSRTELSVPVAIDLVTRMAIVRNHYLQLEPPDIHMP